MELIERIVPGIQPGDIEFVGCVFLTFAILIISGMAIVGGVVRFIEMLK